MCVRVSLVCEGLDRVLQAWYSSLMQAACRRTDQPHYGPKRLYGYSMLEQGKLGCERTMVIANCRLIPIWCRAYNTIFQTRDANLSASLSAELC